MDEKSLARYSTRPTAAAIPTPSGRIMPPDVVRVVGKSTRSARPVAVLARTDSGGSLPSQERITHQREHRTADGLRQRGLAVRSVGNSQHVLSPATVTIGPFSKTESHLYLTAQFFFDRSAAGRISVQKARSGNDVGKNPDRSPKAPGGPQKGPKCTGVQIALRARCSRPGRSCAGYAAAGPSVVNELCTVG